MFDPYNKNCNYIIVCCFVTFETEGIKKWYDKIHSFCRSNMLKLVMHTRKT